MKRVTIHVAVPEELKNQLDLSLTAMKKKHGNIPGIGDLTLSSWIRGVLTDLVRGKHEPQNEKIRGRQVNGHKNARD